MIHELYYLLTGEVRYGLNADIFRDAKLNAHASNGILDVRVAPFIVDMILEGKIKSDDIKFLERLKTTDALIDYGSGGGDMLMRAAKVGNLIGIDVNPGANRAAAEVLKSKGLSGKSQLITGSIADDDAMALSTAKEKMDTKGVKNPVATINFILHDIGPNLSKQFLANHAEVFGSTPLIITETFRMPPEVLRAHPNHQAASFQFMHKASGQNLYTEYELRELLESCGYKVAFTQSHSSMPNADETERLTTIATWIVQFKGK
jgi:predicted O-methyltransferase YrrM